MLPFFRAAMRLMPEYGYDRARLQVKRYARCHYRYDGSRTVRRIITFAGTPPARAPRYAAFCRHLICRHMLY